jgi:hypothetical protein
MSQLHAHFKHLQLLLLVGSATLAGLSWFVIKMHPFSCDYPDDAAAYGYYSPPEASKSNFGHLVIRTTPSFQDEEQMRAAGFLEGWLTAGMMPSCQGRQFVCRSWVSHAHSATHFLAQHLQHISGPPPFLVKLAIAGIRTSHRCSPSCEIAILFAGSIYDHFTNMWAVFNLTGGSDPTIQFQMEQRAWVTERANSDDTQTSPFWSATCLILAQFDGMLAVRLRLSTARSISYCAAAA